MVSPLIPVGLFAQSADHKWSGRRPSGRRRCPAGGNSLGGPPPGGRGGRLAMAMAHVAMIAGDDHSGGSNTYQMTD